LEEVDEVAGVPTGEEEVVVGRAVSVEPSAAALPGLEWLSPDPGLRKEAVGFETSRWLERPQGTGRSPLAEPPPPSPPRLLCLA
jgi:hypothetical protein